jgi:hypothetical protein
MFELKTRIKIKTKSDGSKSYTPQYKWGFIWFSFSKMDIRIYERYSTPAYCITSVTNNKDMCMAFLDRRHTQWKRKVARGDNKTTSVTYERYPV